MMFNMFDIGNDGTLGLDPWSYGGGGSSGSSGRTPLDWNAIINQAFAVGSHAISAFSGQNTGTQVGYNRSQGVFAIQGRPPEQSGYTNPYAGMSPEQIAALQRSQSGGGLDSGLNAALNWISNNPLVLAGVGVGLYLLMREPPRSRR